MIKKKTLLIIPVLLITLLASLLTPISALANEGYEPRLTAPSSKISYYSSKKNVYFQRGSGMPNCVAYAYGRIYEMNGEAPKITHGSACDWYSMNKRNHYYEYGQEPKLGAVACWSNHVAIVEAINADGSITLSESHWHGRYFDTVTYKNMHSHFGQKFYGYIYTYNEPEVEENITKTQKENKTKEVIKNISNELSQPDIDTTQSTSIIANSKPQQFEFNIHEFI